jgi:hypothetical protein
LYDDGSPAVPSSVINGSETLALKRVNNMIVNYAQTFGEMALNAGTMLRQLRSLILAFQALKRGNVRLCLRHLGVTDLTNVVDSANSTWLALRFGWEPLLNDIVNSHDAILQSLKHERSVLTVKAADTASYDALTSTAFNSSGTTEYICETNLAFMVKDEEVQRLNQFGLSNPLATSWELIPYSFVMDWFTGMGNFLWALSAPLGTEFAYGYQNRIARSNLSFHHDSYDASCDIESFGWKRVILSSYPNASPRMNLGLDRNRIATLLSLTGQRIS